MTTIVEFLEARIAEDEKFAATALERESMLLEIRRIKWVRYSWCQYSNDGSSSLPKTNQTPARVLAECKAKRAILALHVPSKLSHLSLFCEDCDWTYPCRTLWLMASVYSDHPDFNPDWNVA